MFTVRSFASVNSPAPARFYLHPHTRLGFRAFRAEVQRQLEAARSNPHGASDLAVATSWLADESPAQFVARFVAQIAAVENGGAQ